MKLASTIFTLLASAQVAHASLRGAEEPFGRELAKCEGKEVEFEVEIDTKKKFGGSSPSDFNCATDKVFDDFCDDMLVEAVKAVESQAEMKLEDRRLEGRRLFSYNRRSRWSCSGSGCSRFGSGDDSDQGGRRLNPNKDNAIAKELEGLLRSSCAGYDKNVKKPVVTYQCIE